jgi:glycosyltransferase involved in cell wall biosynthesis
MAQDEVIGKQIIIYQQSIYRRHSGYGWLSECLKLAFPNARVVTDCSVIRNFDGIVIALRGITFENTFCRPPFYYPKEIAALSTVKGKVILYTSWEFNTLPASVSNFIPRADIFAVISKFMTELFPDSDCHVIRPPVKDLPYKVKSVRTYRVGGLIHPARRRNLQAWVELRSILPRKYRIVLVCAPEIKFDKEAESLIEKAADELLFDLDDRQLAEFYHSLDWFVSFSVGEGYGLPVREALRCGTPVLVSQFTLAMKNSQVYQELYLFQQFGKLA